MENYDLDNFEPAAKIVVIGVGGAGLLHAFGEKHILIQGFAVEILFPLIRQAAVQGA